MCCFFSPFLELFVHLVPFLALNFVPTLCLTSTFTSISDFPHFLHVALNKSWECALHSGISRLCRQLNWCFCLYNNVCPSMTVESCHKIGFLSKRPSLFDPLGQTRKRLHMIFYLFFFKRVENVPATNVTLLEHNVTWPISQPIILWKVNSRCNARNALRHLMSTFDMC